MIPRLIPIDTELIPRLIPRYRLIPRLIPRFDTEITEIPRLIPRLPRLIPRLLIPRYREDLIPRLPRFIPIDTIYKEDADIWEDEYHQRFAGTPISDAGSKWGIFNEDDGLLLLVSLSLEALR